MSLIDLLAAGGTLVATVAVGIVLHELSHALVLRAFGIPFRVEWRPDSDAPAPLGVGLLRALASVTPEELRPETSVRGLRLAAVAPFVLAAPHLLVVLGVVPDPFTLGRPVLAAAAIAWLGCALPSPQDFSLFWHAPSLTAGGWDGS